MALKPTALVWHTLSVLFCKLIGYCSILGTSQQVNVNPTSDNVKKTFLSRKKATLVPQSSYHKR